MKLLVVKLSSLGDVVHTMPALQDIRQALPGAQIDWVVERGFAPLVRRCDGVARVIESDLRQWRRAPLAAAGSGGFRDFLAQLRRESYDAVIDLQGLTKSALVARLARLAPGGLRFALANRTDGAGYEAPTRWLADVAIRVPAYIHAVQRGRELCARALGYAVPSGLRFCLLAAARVGAGGVPVVALVHGSSRTDKCWPDEHWLELGRRLIQAGYALALPSGSQAELARSQALAHTLGPAAQAWPMMDLGELCDRLAACSGVLGVDSGPSHIAVALNLPHVQLYNFDTAWRTGPLDTPHQLSVYGLPVPAVDAVWQAWQRAAAAAPLLLKGLP